MGDNPWLEFDPDDYYFGDKVLRIDITTTFGQPRNYHDCMCLLVEGMEYAWDGSPLGVRRAYIRVSALAAAGVPGLTAEPRRLR